MGMARNMTTKDIIDSAKNPMWGTAYNLKYVLENTKGIERTQFKLVTF